MANESPNPSEAGHATRSEAPHSVSAGQPQSAAESAAGGSQPARGPEERAAGRLSRREPSAPFGFWRVSPFSLMQRVLEDMDRLDESVSARDRAIPLPERAKVEGAEAQFADGVLEISIPLEEQRARSRRLDVQGCQQKPPPGVH